MSYIISKLIMIPIVLIALTFHEFSHGWVSYKLGDPTPRMEGRLTLNPLAHLDPIGALLMIITGFGWAKPVSINPRYYKNPKTGMAITAAAGPISNLLMAVLSMLIYTALVIIGYKAGLSMVVIDKIGQFLYTFSSVNLCFAVFNIIPIPPLDGSRVLGLFLSSKWYFKIQQYERYGFMLIIVLSLTNAFNKVIGTGVNFVMDGIQNLCNAIVNVAI